jgi:hypothetical protein
MRSAIALAAPVPFLLAVPQQALAQARDIGSTASAVYPNDPEYKDLPMHLGSLNVSLGGEARVEYDTNVYATPSNARDDVHLELTPEVQIATAPGPLSAQAHGSATIRRFADLKTENTEAWVLDGSLRWSPETTTSVTGRAFYQRAVEERGSPESRQNPNDGPREIDSLGVDLRFRHMTRRLLFDLQGNATKYDALSAADANRDFTGLNGVATVGWRVTGITFVTASAFVAKRDFRLERTPSGSKRNTTTWGGRVGVEFEPGGVLEGNLSAGMFRFVPEDSLAKSRTGLSVSGSVTYRPRQRTAFMLDAFNGDVATFRSGAQSRTDTTVKLSVQQEIRHNLYATVGGGYRRSRYNGSGVKEQTPTVSGEIEYIFSRRMSVAAYANYGKRTSDDPTLEFDRAKVGASFRMRF